MHAHCHQSALLLLHAQEHAQVIVCGKEQPNLQDPTKVLAVESGPWPRERAEKVLDQVLSIVCAFCVCTTLVCARKRTRTHTHECTYTLQTHTHLHLNSRTHTHTPRTLHSSWLATGRAAAAASSGSCATWLLVMPSALMVQARPCCASCSCCSIAASCAPCAARSSSLRRRSGQVGGW